MFWKYNFGSSAQIETLLGKEDVTLQELMDEDELLQECKARNRKLIEFLTREDILQELVNLVVNEPPQDKEITLRFKYANLAAELLTSDVPDIVDKLVGSTSLLDVLYKFLEKEKPLNPLLASFFSKVLGMLVQRRSEQNWYSYQFTCFQVLDFLKTKGDFVEAAVGHVGTSAIMDLLLKLICNVEEDEIRQSVHQWFCENHLVERLLERLSPEADSDEHTSAGQILCEIVVSAHDPSQDNGTSSPIFAKLESEESVNKLLDLLLHEERNESSVTHVINVLLTLLNSRAQPQTQQQIQQQQQQQIQQQQQQQQQKQQQTQLEENEQNQQRLKSESSVDSSDSESGDTRRHLVARTIAKRLPSVQNLLLHPPKKGLLMTAYGQEMEPLGSTRLQVITLITALVMTNDSVVHTALAQLKTISHLLDLFFKFLLNNFVHTQVEKCLTAIITQSPPPSTPQSESSHPLLNQLITHCRIIQRIMDAHDDQTDKEESKCPHNLKGYMGHLRQLANAIVQQAEFGPNEALLKQLIQDLPGETATHWDEFISNALAEINRNNEVQQLPGFKEMDMETIGDFRYADDEFKDHDFKDPDDNLSGPLQRLTTQALSLAAAAAAAGGGKVAAGEGGRSAPTPPGEDHDLFEEMCTQRLQDMHDFDDIWTDKEKEITFNQESIDSQRSKEKEGHSSSEEEDEDEELSGIRNQEEKMEVDQDDWAEVFDKRSSGGSTGDAANPWQSAPMSDTSDNTGWADFGAFGGSRDPFVSPREPNKDTNGDSFKADFSNAISSEKTTEKNAFQADFTNVNFDAKFEANCDVPKVEGLQNSIGKPTVVAGTEVSKEVGAHKGKGGVSNSKTQDTADVDLTENFNFLSSRGLLKNNSSEVAPALTVAAIVDAAAAAADDNDVNMSVSSSSSNKSTEPMSQEGGNAAAS